MKPGWTDILRIAGIIVSIGMVGLYALRLAGEDARPSDPYILGIWVVIAVIYARYGFRRWKRPSRDPQSHDNETPGR